MYWLMLWYVCMRFCLNWHYFVVCYWFRVLLFLFWCFLNCLGCLHCIYFSVSLRFLCFCCWFILLVDLFVWVLILVVCCCLSLIWLNLVTLIWVWIEFGVCLLFACLFGFACETSLCFIWICFDLVWFACLVF